jgi:glutathione S-transferase
MSISSPPRLIHFRVSHYNEKVRWALDYKRWPHLRRDLVPGWHALAARRLSGQTSLPILEIDGRVLVDSTAIIAEIERLRPEPPLYPADPTDRARALALEDYFDEEVAPDLRRLFWSCYLHRPADCARMATDGRGTFARLTWRALFPFARPLFRRQIGTDPGRVANARARLAGFFDRLESEVRPSGYLAGEAFSIADLAVAAVMTALIRPPQFSYPLPDPWPSELKDLRASVADRAGFQWVLDIYARHRGTSSEITAREKTHAGEGHAMLRTPWPRSRPTPRRPRPRRRPRRAGCVTSGRRASTRRTTPSGSASRTRGA